MPEPVVGKENQNQKEQPLVAATVAFLKEFKGKDGVVVGAGARNGNGSVGKKGKEREREEREEDDWDGDSFLPSYVYDAMKEKKRFDNMRVCFFSSYPFFSWTGTDLMGRADTRKTRKSSLGFIWIPWKRSCFRYYIPLARHGKGSLRMLL